MDLDRYRREDVSMIFQAFRLLPLMSVAENVCYPMQLSGVDREDARRKSAEYLAYVGIGSEMLGRFPSHLSGGEQQRVAIARSLASGARLILADEPTGNLDSVNSMHIMEILQKLAHESGYCIIVVTHDADVAGAADIMYKMSDGVLVL